MDVKVERMFCNSLADNKKVEPQQYRVRVDRLVAGYIGWHEGAKLMLIKSFGPIEREEIEKKVAEQMPNVHGERVDSMSVPEHIPPELLKTNQQLEQEAEETLDADDFDS